MAIDRENNTRGYLLGRLFFMLQQTWLAESDQAMLELSYKAALERPSHIFPNMMKWKDGQIGTFGGECDFLKQELNGILSELEGFPDHLTPQDQARFALGYHHQQQTFKEFASGKGNARAKGSSMKDV